MKVKALIGFGGAFSMYKGEIKECNNNVILQDLLKSKYVEEVKEPEEPKKGRTKNGENEA